MSFQCYTSRTSMRSTLTGGLFISADGSQRIIPDHWLVQAELLNGSRLLRLSYSFCTIEVSGRNLDPIFEDAGIGKLGAVQASASEKMPSEQLWVTNIIVVAPPEPPSSASEQEYFDA
ncbi:MAG: hypothetical protein JXA73_03075 [Acidobacteria bacterium]|nr:hypothetical protein [Acidobacteriota bacterium]